MPSNVATRSARQEELEHRRQLPRDLRIGTSAMLKRSKGLDFSKEGGDPLSDYLPRYPGEAEEEYRFRRSRSVLYNGYGYTVGYIAGKILSRPITLSEVKGKSDLVAAISALASNVDGEGQDLTRFAWQLVPEAIDSGVTYIFVDWTGDTTGKNREQAKGAGARFIHVPPSAVVKMRYRKKDGRPEVARLQIEEGEEVADDHWSESTRRMVRVHYAPGEERSDGKVSKWLSWELWEVPREGDPVLEKSVESPPMTFIPVVPFYTRRDGFMEGLPALEDQAWLQLSHWKKRSNLDNVLDVCTAPTLERVGISADEAKQNQVGVYRFFWSGDKDARTKWIELEGSGVKLLMEDVTNLEARIMLLGMQPMVAKPTGGLVTATERLLDEQNSLSQLEAWALSLQDSLELCFRYVANWYGVADLPDSIVQVQADLTFDAEGADGDDFLTWMRDRGDLSREGLYEQAKLRGRLPDRFNPEEEAKRVAAERRGGVLVLKGLQQVGGGAGDAGQEAS